MQELVRNKFSFPIKFLNGKTVYINYEQATLRDLLQMGKTINNPESLTVWLYDFLSKNTKNNDKITLKMFANLQTIHINNIVTYLFSTYAKGYFKEVKEGEDKETPKQKAPDSSLFALIFEETNETIESLLNMTWEQIEFLLDGITWNLRGKTKEGQAENSRQWALRKSRESMSDNEAIEHVRKLEEKLATKKIKYGKRERTI